MKTQTFNLGFTLGFLLLASQVMYSQEELKKEFHEEFETNINTVLTLDNKYGDIDVKDWEKKLIQQQPKPGCHCGRHDCAGLGGCPRRRDGRMQRRAGSSQPDGH